MIKENNVLVIDIDGTICEEKKENKRYSELSPIISNIKKMIEYKKKGFYIILYTSRQMRTHQGNLGRINAQTAKELFTWLDKHNLPYDEIHFGKPWCGNNGFYVDDKSIRPREFRELKIEEIHELISKDR